MCGIWAVFGSDDDVTVQCNACHKIGHRGPDCFRMENINHYGNCCLGFHRLAIVDDLTGMQPMRLYSHPHIWLIYNGEIYNYKRVGEEFNFKYSTHCDGESLIHLYTHGGVDYMAKHLDGVFAFCLLDTESKKIHLGRDTYGVRPMFTIHGDDGFLAVCSEAKGLLGLTKGNGQKIEAFTPGYIETYALQSSGKTLFEERRRFHTIGDRPEYKTAVPKSGIGNDTKINIRMFLDAAVEKRMIGERRLGCLLSGGLDSSLIAALVVRKAKVLGLQYRVQTFAIGMEGSTDLIAARKVASYLGTEHHEVVFTPEEGLEAIDKVIYHLESYDITTIRASIGMYLLSKYISEKTDTRVIFSGEGSDELTQGYVYFKKAPGAAEGDEESRRLLYDLYMYDVLRADRTTAAWGLELRVPFLDHQFTAYYLSLAAEERQPRGDVEKFCLRSAFDGCHLIPEEILWRPKEAFSDGVSSLKQSWYEVLQTFTASQVNDRELKQSPLVFSFNSPLTKESYYYRRIFERFYPSRSKWIPYIWMPRWTQADDPSARTLKVYKQ